MSVIVECKRYSPGNFPRNYSHVKTNHEFIFFKLRGEEKYSFGCPTVLDPFSEGQVKMAVRIVTRKWDEIPYYELRDEDTGKLIRSGRIPPRQLTKEKS